MGVSSMWVMLNYDTALNFFNQGVGATQIVPEERLQLVLIIGKKFTLNACIKGSLKKKDKES